MSEEKYHQNWIVGAAVVTGILSALSALMQSNRTVQSWTEQAKDAANQVLEKGEAVNKNMLLGGVAGGLIGAAAALLLAPKAGVDLIKDLTHPFSHESAHARSASRKSSSKSASRKSPSRKKTASSSAKSGVVRHKGAEKREEGKSHPSSSKKKSPPRRRTATAALKQVVTHPEKVVSEATNE